MTTHDATPYPSPDEPERIGQLFGEVFDLVDETVDGITDAEVDRALRQVYADGELGQTANLDELAEMLTRTDWKVSSTGPVKLGQDPAELAAWTEVTVARAAASAARAEAQMHIAAAAKARQQAAEVTAGAKAFVDKALDEAKTTKTDAKKKAARLIAEAKQQAEEILAAARASAATAEPSPIAHWATRDLMAGPRLMLITGAAGAGKTWLATELMTRIAEAGETVSGFAAAQWRDDLIAPLAGLERFANLLEPAATAFRDIVGHHHGAVRQALTSAYQSSRYPAGSLCRTTVFRYACDDQLEADLDPTFDTPDRCLAAHHGRAADTAHWAELFRTRMSLADWKVPIPFDAIDNCDIDAVAQTGTWVRVADCPDAATFRHLPVDCESAAGSTKSGDAIAVRFTSSSDGRQKVVIIDGGFLATGEQLVEHMLKYYGTNHIDLVISTHPDGDHLNGLLVVIEKLHVDELMIHQPRQHVGSQVAHFRNIEAIDNLIDTARSWGTRLADPFTGAEHLHGQLVVLGPTKDFYELLVEEHLQEVLTENKSITFSQLRRRARNLFDSALGMLPFEETLIDLGETSPRNETSVVTLLQVDGHRLLFTGDAGQRALTAAAED
jgi:DNA replication protein DnaC